MLILRAIYKYGFVFCFMFFEMILVSTIINICMIQLNFLFLGINKRLNALINYEN